MKGESGVEIAPIYLVFFFYVVVIVWPRAAFSWQFVSRTWKSYFGDSYVIKMSVKP